MIGKLISALSNAALLADEDFAYVVWGIRDSDHAAVGTTFRPTSKQVSSQPFELWLSQRVKPDIATSFQAIEYGGVRIVQLCIPAATTMPVEFDRAAYIRIGSTTPRLSAHPERLKALGTKLQPYVWKTGIAVQFLSGDDVLSRLDYSSYFELTDQPLLDNRAAIFEKLSSDRLIAKDAGEN